ncbi:peptidoglycan-binding protein [Myxococcaceae bacterium JPH2]|nr:peptidoglycan-binding protein [Myxococcaceae bacterium JPH2]
MPRKHTVKAGEHLMRIARKYGLPDWKALYDAPENAAFKQRRPNPFVILPGDTLHIPDAAPAEVKAGTGKQHTFTLKKAQTTLKLQLHDDGPDARPLARARYHLDIEGAQPVEGQTDGEGWLETPVPVDAEEATLTVWLTEQESMEWTLELSHLTPSDDVAGARARLNNLGFDSGDPSAAEDPLTEQMLRAFQQAHGLEEQEALGPQTRARLEREHGC